MFRKKEILWITVVILFMFFGRTYASLISFDWTPNREPDLAGYYLHYDNGYGYCLAGEEEENINGVIYCKMDLGNKVGLELSAHCPYENCSYTFMLTAYDTEGNESGYSNKLFYNYAKSQDDDDNDSIGYWDEIEIYQTDPDYFDTDMDAISDKDEIDYWGDGWYQDIDSDGIINLLDPDSDGDGFLDGIEIAQGSDPATSWNALAGQSAHYGPDGDILRWIVYDNNPGGAAIISVFDDILGENVVELFGSGWDNGYYLKGPNSYVWGNTSQFVATWSIRTSEISSYYWEVNTTAGMMYLQYTLDNVHKYIGTQYVKYGLGSGLIDDAWHVVVRDLRDDLLTAFPDVEILEIKGFKVRGSGRITHISLSSYVQATVYSKGTNVGRWLVEDSSPSGAMITTIFDHERNSDVIVLTGSGWDNSYRLKAPAGYRWGNTSQHKIAWSFRTTDIDFTVYVEIETNDGTRWHKYKLLDQDGLGTGTYISFGIGTGKADDDWHTINVNLETDLKTAQPNLEINKVNGFIVRGNGRIGEVLLKD